MSHKPSEAHYVEGVHRFWIDEGYVVCRIECSDYYARQAQNFCGGCKEMDFLLYHPERRDLWLVEVKDYRFDARPKGGGTGLRPEPQGPGYDVSSPGRFRGRPA